MCEYFDNKNFQFLSYFNVASKISWYPDKVKNF